MQIEATVDESDIGQIRQGQEVRFTVQAYPDRTFTGKVTQIRLQPQTISNVVNYTVIVQADNDKGLLLPGMTATVDFVVARAENALLVPNAALRFEPTRQGEQQRPEDRRGPTAAGGRPGQHRPPLHPRREGTACSRCSVTKGPTDGISTVVSGEGLREGMEVVTGLKPQDPDGAQRPGASSPSSARRATATERGGEHGNHRP